MDSNNVPGLYHNQPTSRIPVNYTTHPIPVAHDHSSNLFDIPGLKFNPSDVELVDFYLKNKNKNNSLALSPNWIYEFSFYNHTPHDISEMFKANGNDDYWIFFTRRSKKYLGGTRPDRAVAGGRGYWKAEGVDKKIENHGAHVGNRKLLAYYDGNYKNGEKTDWRLHELIEKKAPEPVNKDTMMLEDWVVCKLYKTKTSKRGSKNVQIGLNPPSFPARITVGINPAANGQEEDHSSPQFFGLPDAGWAFTNIEQQIPNELDLGCAELRNGV